MSTQIPFRVKDFNQSISIMAYMVAPIKTLALCFCCTEKEDTKKRDGTKTKCTKQNEDVHMFETKRLITLDGPQ